MGKSSANQQLPSPHGRSDGGASRRFFCERCSVVVRRVFSVKCCVVLMLSFAVFLSAFFSVVHIGYREPGFDAKSSIRLRAIVQVNFKLQRPVSDLLPYIPRLEYDVNDEIGVPSMKVTVLSMHPMGLPNMTTLSNWTDVVVGFIPDSVDSTMTSVSLSVLKSSLVDLFLLQNNLTLTSSIFGQPSSFQMLKFPGGITILPERVSLVVEPLFTFVLSSSIYEITQNLPELKEQLKWGLHLMPNEVIYIQVTNQDGSTSSPPVSVEASVASNLGLPMPERLRQLAQIITKSPPTENLGLDHSVFGKVKQISLSSFLSHSLQAPAPASSPSPAPSPGLGRIHDTQPPIVQSYPPAFSPDSRSSGPSPRKLPYHSLAPVSDSPEPSVARGSPDCGSTHSPSPSPSHRSNQNFPHLTPYSGSPVKSAAQQIAPSPDGKNGFSFVSPLHASWSSPSSYLSSVSGTLSLCMFYSTELLTILVLFS